MSFSTRVQQSFVMLVLMLHLIWIVNHLRWVANDQIDPWKLGGYGMYAKPSPQVRIVINSVAASGRIERVESDRYSLQAYYRSSWTNTARVFRCAPVGPEPLRAFFDENVQLRGVDLIFVFLERQLSRDPVALQGREQGRVQVQWIGDRDLVYGSLFCGKVGTGEISWP